MKRELEPYQMIERSIIKKYRKELWTPFIVAVKRYELVQEGDKIAVCISGGKDSMLMAKLMQELQKHSDVPFELVFLVMDPGYNEINRQKIESNAELLHIPVTIFESNIFSVANNTEKNPCYLCARMRRGHLYSKAKELGCNKIALGHHFNDVIETTVMSMFYGSQMQAMPPKLHSTSFPGMTLIRPMYCIREEDILAWKRYNDLEFIQCACRFTENCTMCDNGWDDIFEKEREFMKPLEKGPFYCCKQYCGAYGTLGGVLINHKMEVMTDDYEVIPGLYCVGTDACTIYGDSYNYCIPGNTMGFCLNSGRIAGENAAAALFEDAGDEEWS